MAARSGDSEMLSDWCLSTRQNTEVTDLVVWLESVYTGEHRSY